MSVTYKDGRPLYRDELGCQVRGEFPLLRQRDVAFLDSAASAQKPRSVLEAMEQFYRRHYANVHRGVYSLSQEATELYETAREKVRAFLNAASTREIVFTRGTTEAINLVAYSWGRSFLREGDEILTTILEHHSNFVPWQILAAERGVKLRYVFLNPDGSFAREQFSSLLSSRTKLVTCTMLSNALGMDLPVEELIAEAHTAGALVLLDAAQGAPHRPLDVQDLDVDFLTCSAHKMYGPTGIGVLYAREALLDSMPPFLSGGDMIRSVALEETTFNELPYKFEAGTPPIAEAIGFGAACDFVRAIGFEQILRHEAELTRELVSELGAIPALRILGRDHHGIVSFTVDGIHAHDVAQFLDRENVAIRAGHHCAQPLLTYLGQTATCRASLGMYSTLEDINRLTQALTEAIRYFSGG